MSETLPDVRPALTVFVHAHYLDVWQDMRRVLAARLRVPFDLVITTPHAAAKIARPETPALRSVRVLEVENRGRDILPFLRALQLTDRCDLGLKLHTKRSPQRADGTQWRAQMLDALMPSRSVVRAIVTGMAKDRRIGLVAPARFCLSVRPWVLLNAPGMIRIMSILGVELTDSDLDDTYFAAGSMFWFRRGALESLAVDRVMDIFEPETGQLDGTIAHAMERLFPVEARRQGYLSMAVPALLSSRPRQPRAEVLKLARRHADRPSTFFPGPNREALPPRPRSRADQLRMKANAALWSFRHVLASRVRLARGAKADDQPPKLP